MEIIGVLDLADGRAVHARGGVRSRYAAVPAAGGRIIDGDALALARVYRDRWDLDRLYAADLDGIAGSPMQDDLIRALAATGPLWLDAGITSASEAEGALELGVDRVVVGLETLPSWSVLEQICGRLGGRRVVFSLDCRNGVPVLPDDSPIRDVPSIEQLAARAAGAGAAGLILLDLARVGMGRGPDLGLVARVRTRIPGSQLVVGGGIRDGMDLDGLEDAGCDAALVATALQDGSLDTYLRLPGPHEGG